MDHKISLFALTLGLATPCATPAAAQPQTVDLVDEVIVTARRTEERAQDVPISISAVSGAALLRANVTDITKIQTLAPSLTVAPAGGAPRVVPAFAMRGLVQSDATSLSDQSVSVYIGDIVAARLQGLDSTFFDLGSVEVLKGPQGTLFGRNSTGGAVIIRAAKPVDRFSAMGSVTVGNHETLNAQAMLNVPLVEDKVLLRVAGAVNLDGGYVYDEILKKNIDDTDRIAYRISLLVRPTPQVESLTIFNHFRADEGSTPTFLSFANPNGPLNTPAVRGTFNLQPIEQLRAEQIARGIYRVANGTLGFTKVTTSDIANTTTFQATDSLTLKNIIGYRQVKDHLFADMDGSSNTLDPQERFDRGKQFSEEFQLLGTGEKLTWIAGLYYFRETGRNAGIVAIPGRDPGPIDFLSAFDYPNHTITENTAKNISYAAYAQGTYDLSSLLEGLSVTLGGRITHDVRHVGIFSRTATACRFTIDDDNNPATPETLPPLSQCEFHSKASFSEPTYTASLQYKFATDKLVYVAHRHGYRSGGFGARAATSAGLSRTFKPEIVDDIELGMKADWRPGGTFLRTNIAAYHSKYSDIQRLLLDPRVTPPTIVTVNAGRARIRGLEIEVLFRPIPQLELFANYAYTDAKFLEFIAPDGSDLTGNPFSRAPKNVYTLGARYTSILAGELGTLSFGANYFHSDRYISSDNFEGEASVVHGYHTVNLDATWSSVMGSGVDLSAFANNVTGVRYSLPMINLNSLGFTSQMPGRPRTYGVTVRYQF